jgi:trk system potassium uptake protein TrkA
MQITIVGAGSVGKALAIELDKNGYNVTLIDKDADAFAYEEHEKAFEDEREYGYKELVGDACNPKVLEHAELFDSDALVAATGDDQTNLVVSLLARTEFGMPRTIARVNEYADEWLFSEGWGVDISVSMPSVMTQIVEEILSIGELVEVFRFKQSGSTLLQGTVKKNSPLLDKYMLSASFPHGIYLLAVEREGNTIKPIEEDVFERYDKVLFLAEKDAGVDELEKMFEM